MLNSLIGLLILLVYQKKILKGNNTLTFAKVSIFNGDTLHNDLSQMFCGCRLLNESITPALYW